LRGFVVAPLANSRSSQQRLGRNSVLLNLPPQFPDISEFPFRPDEMQEFNPDVVILGERRCAEHVRLDPRRG
jgi:hypothetical protein